MSAKYYSSRKLINRQGAILAELALLVPFFLALIFFIVWIGLVTNEKGALNFAVANGLRLSSTRISYDKEFLEDDYLDNNTYLSAINEYLPPGNDSTNIFPLLSSSPNITNWENIYNGFIAGDVDREGYPNCTLKSLSPRYLLALIYINQYMKKSLGNSVRFPCDPAGDPPVDGPGCLKCYVVPADYRSKDTTSYEETECSYPKDYLNIKCEYRGNSFLLDAIALFGSAVNNQNLSIYSAQANYRIPYREWIYAE